MNFQILCALECSQGSDSHLIETIRANGGTAIAEIENHQPNPRLQIASVHYAGIVGLGPGLLGAARDWRRQATARVKL